MKTCPKCNKEFDSKNKNKIYCSSRCYSNAKGVRHYSRVGHSWLNEESRNKEHKCEKCKRIYLPTRNNQKYCSSKCSSESRKIYLNIPECLEQASRKLDKNIGYVRVYCPMHPMANTWGYVYEHRLIMESLVGRFLNKDEHVHHINGKRWDNSPENLQLLLSSEHSKIKKNS